MTIYKIERQHKEYKEKNVILAEEEGFFEHIKEYSIKAEIIRFVNEVALFGSEKYIFKVSKIDLKKLKLCEIEEDYIKLLNEDQQFELYTSLFPAVKEIIDEAEYFFHYHDARDIALQIFRKIIEKNPQQTANWTLHQYS